MAQSRGKKEKRISRALSQEAPYDYAVHDLGSLDKDQLLQQERELEVRDLRNKFIKKTKTRLHAGGRTEKVKNENSIKFENTCLDIIKVTTNPEFQKGVEPAKGKNRAPNPDGRKVVRPDIYMLNQYKDGGSVWEFLKNNYACKQLLFECKNYTSKISSKEVFQLYEYLDPDRKGKVGFILCRYNKIDDTGHNAIRRLQKDGYLIVPIYDEIILKWIDYYIENGEVGSFFYGVVSEASEKWSP